MAHPSPRTAIRPAREAARGAATAWRGLRTWSKSPRLMAWGLLPGVATAVVFFAAGIAVASQLGRWTAGLASIFTSEGEWAYGPLRIIAGLAIVAGAVLVAIYAFTAVTLTIGQPFFERISRAVDESHGFSGDIPDEKWPRAIARSVSEAVRLTLLTGALAIGLFLIGLLPVVGGIIAFVLGASIGGWFLALELTAYPLARRGVVSLAERRGVLSQRRARVVGFGAAVFLMFLIPLGAALFMPAVVAGATLLVQDANFDADRTADG